MFPECLDGAIGAHPQCQSHGSWGPGPFPAIWKPSPNSSDEHVP